MPTKAQREAAESLKEEGNKLFSRSKYNAAIEKYTEAITLVSDNAVLFVNRAMANRKKEAWDHVMRDAMMALQLDKDHMKAHYLAGLAFLQEPNYDAGIRHLSKALELAREANDAIRDNIWRELAQAKYAEWQRDSAQRKAQLEALKAVVACLPPSTGGAWDQRSQERALQDKATQDKTLQDKFAWLFNSVIKLDTPTEVPSIFTCPLTMETFRDPAITKYGQSYERAALLAHLSKNKWDPITRQPLTEADVVPNLALRQAVQQYLDEHPWAWRECM